MQIMPTLLCTAPSTQVKQLALKIFPPPPLLPHNSQRSVKINDFLGNLRAIFVHNIGCGGGCNHVNNNMLLGILIPACNFFCVATHQVFTHIY